MPEYPLPKYIDDNNAQPSALDHPALAYYQFLPVPGDLKDEDKAGHLREIQERFNSSGPWQDACSHEAGRLLAAARSFEAQGRPVSIIEVKTATRLLIGMGYKNALEVGMTFHQPGGFPYVPGSSVKGLCRAWPELVEAPDPDNEQAVAVHRSHLKRVFGSASKDEEHEAGAMEAGSVCFLDAFPTQFPRLEVDLMNPHFSLYYNDEEGNIPPGDWLQPIVIPFLAVGPGQEFRFVIVGRDAEAAEDVEQAGTWLGNALAELGAGGKTAAGYGYFTATILSVAQEEWVEVNLEGDGRKPASADIKWLDTITRTTDGVYAKVIGHKGRLNIVTLFVRDLEGQEFELGGGTFDVDTLLTVQTIWSNKSKKIVQLGDVRSVR